MKSTCRVERDGEILVVTLDRQEKLNAMNAAMHEELELIWNDFFADTKLRVGILTGAGDKAFSVGSDLSSYHTGAPPARLANGYAGLTHRLDASKPIIAAVNGLALGGGFEVMLCCDLVVAAEHAEFGLPEPMVGAAALGGGIPRLCRKLPFNRAMGLLLTGDRLSAADALQWGLVNQVVPAGHSVEAAKQLALRIIRGAPLATQVTKQIADASFRGMSLADALEFEAGWPMELVMNSDDFQEGVTAFLDKRHPLWQGR